MKTILTLVAIATILAGCKTRPENASRSTLEIQIGTNRIISSTPKEYKIKKLSWTTNGFEVEGLNSAVNVNAVEAQTAQTQANQQSFGQTMQLLQLMSVLASQKTGGGGINQPPQVVTNYIQLPPTIVTNFATVKVPVEGSFFITNTPTVNTNK